jgi:alanyl-tRNA synthetase
LRVVAIVRDGRSVEQLGDGEAGVVLLDRTPFYAESGGQVGDIGELAGAGGNFRVADTVKLAGTFHGHVGTWHGAPLRTGAFVSAEVDAARRQAVVLNHSATHLLHAALRQVLGDHVTQKGSLVAPDRLRFDFSHFQPMTGAQLAAVEQLVNAQIRRNSAADAAQMGYKDAIEAGAMALFGEKYGEHVRVLRMGDFSTELCGGTHVSRTGDIGLFRITSESGVAAGVRRIEAVTGEGAQRWTDAREAILGEAARLLAASPEDVVDKLRALFDRQKKLEKELESLKARSAGSALDQVLAAAADVNGIKVIAARLDGVDAKMLREGVDQAKQRLGNAVVLLAAGADGKASLVAGVAGAALAKVKAGDLLGHVAKAIGGKGGGRPDLAQGGGEDSPQLDRALAGVADWVRERLV